jgi:hypothetical protein
MALDPQSAFWAHGLLTPRDATHFDVQNMPVETDVYVEVYGNGIAVWSHAGAQFARSVDDARELMYLTAAAYTVITGVALDFSFTGWVEAKSAQFTGTMIGFTGPRGHKPDISAATQLKRTERMEAAVKIAAHLLQEGPWRLALRDVHLAHLAAITNSDDSFVFAYRAIEDLAHAVSPIQGKKSWLDLHALLGTTEKTFKRRTKLLSEARNAVVHGDAHDPRLVAARAQHGKLVKLSRSILRDALRAHQVPGA